MERTINFNQRSGFSGTGLPGANRIKERIYNKKPFGESRLNAGAQRKDLDLTGEVKKRIQANEPGIHVKTGRNGNQVVSDLQALTRYPGTGTRLDISDSAQIEIKVPKRKPAVKLISDSSELRSHAGERTLGLA